MNLSLMSVGNKQINPGLTYFILSAAELDSTILPSTESASSKDKLQNVCSMQIFFLHYLPLFDIWKRLFFSNFLNTLPLISTN